MIPAQSADPGTLRLRRHRPRLPAAVKPDHPATGPRGFAISSGIGPRLLIASEGELMKWQAIWMSALFAGILPGMAADSGGWKQLFNGKDLTGWKHVGPGSMTVNEGLIETHGGMGLLYWTGRQDQPLHPADRVQDAGSQRQFGRIIRIPVVAARGMDAGALWLRSADR